MILYRVRLVLMLFSQWSLFCRSEDSLCPPILNKPTCMCKHRKGILDLTPLSFSDGTPWFEKVTAPSEATYSYNPCTVFSELTCYDTYVCLEDPSDPNEALNLADTGSEQIYINGSGIPYAHYSSSSGGTSVKVYLICTSEHKPTLLPKGKDLVTDDYNLELSSCLVCPGGCKTQCKTQSIVGVAGLVIMILFCAALITYFVAGALILKFKYQAEGLDVIPNRNFWTDLPVLIKDGILFICEPITRRLSNKNNYAKL